jgi:ribosomal protein L21E
MDVQEITFGVEIETTIPHGALSVGVGPHGCGTPIPELPGWVADRDPSICVRARGHEPCEFVSPVFRGTAGLKQLLADLAVIRSKGAKVNESCGLHIHVGFDKSNAEAVAKLATLVSNFEKAIYASTGTKKREQSRWCNGLRRHGNAQTAVRASQSNRYHVANFGTTKPTVEFRAFSGTLNAAKLVGYIRLCVGLVERALNAKRTTDWTAKSPVESSPIHKNGEGQTALNRLFYQLGWTKGRQPHTHGDLSGDGLPTIVRTKRELMRLAEKYDAADARELQVGRRVRVQACGTAHHGRTGTLISQHYSSWSVELEFGERVTMPRRSLIVVND